MARPDQRFARFVRRTFGLSGRELASLMLVVSFYFTECLFIIISSKNYVVKQNQPIEILFAMRAVFFSWLACLPPAHQDRLAFESVWHRLHDTLDDVHESDRLFNIFPDQWLNEVAKQHQ